MLISTALNSSRQRKLSSMKRHITLRATVVCLLMLPSALAFAQKAPVAAPALDPARVAAAKELIAATGGTDAAKKSMEQMTAAISAQMRGQNPAQAEKFTAVMTKHLAPEGTIVKTYLTEVSEAFVTFYAANFTVPELAEIKTFQASATGKKFQVLAPQMMSGMAAPMMKMQQSLMVEIQKDLKP
jgi:uncharacterized protein